MMVTTTLRYALCGTRRADGGCSAGKAVRQRRGHITNVRRKRRGEEEEEEATAAAATAGQHRLCQWPQERSA